MPRVAPLDPSTYVRHRTHQPGRTWAETNCYTDVVIELLHGLGHEPLAALPFTLTIDLDVDQWTFFKFPHQDIAALYALGVHELAPWRPLVEHLEELAAAGLPVLVELDSFYLPDTAGSAYGLAHVKSTVAVNEVDRARGGLGYFHNQGYHWLEGQDFLDVLQVGGLVHPRMMPPYIEIVKPLPRARALRGADLVEGSLAVLQQQLRLRPETNPFRRFRVKFEADMPGLLEADLEHFHAYSFATLRQYGACYELASTYLSWLGEQGVDGLQSAVDDLGHISTATKALQLRLARSMMRKKALDLSVLDELALRWDAAMELLVARHG
jgi:hypothetical protein